MTTSKALWRILKFSRKIWVRAALYCVLAVASALLALIIKPFIPHELPAAIGSDAVDSLLTILGSSMLAVTTFTLNIMVSSLSTVSSAATPRAARLVLEDDTAQGVLSTFLGSFLFSLVGLIVLKTGLYGAQGRVVLFVITIFVIIMIVLTFLRWIDHLATLGRLSDALDRVEQEATNALRWRVRNPTMGGRRLVDASKDIPADATPVLASAIGYVAHVDTGAINELAGAIGACVHLVATPGSFVADASPVAFLSVDDERARVAIADCFSIESERTFEQDPRFGVLVLAEIASRALSPAVNDPGTAIDVLGRLVRVLTLLRDDGEREDARYEHVFVPALATDELFNDAFRSIGRDGGKLVEVCVRLQKSLLLLSQAGDEAMTAAAIRQSALALRHADSDLGITEDKEWVRMLAQQVAARRA